MSLIRWAVVVGALAIIGLLAYLQGGNDRAVNVAGDMHIVKVGQERVVSLPGNPSTGYSWRLDEAGSEHSEILGIEDLGYASPEPTAQSEQQQIVGVPQEQRFRLTGKTIGMAKLAFEYVRPWEGEAVERKVVLVEVRRQ